MFPTTVWVLASKDRAGNARDINKTTGFLFMTPEAAEAAHEHLDEALRKYYTVEPCVIMGQSYYEQLR